MPLKLNPEIYDAQSAELMRKRGIIKGDETVTDVLERVLNAMIEIDTRLNKNQVDLAYQQALTDMVSAGQIIFGTPILTNAGRAAQVTAACTVLPVNVLNGQADYQQFGKSSYSTLGQALGTGYDLSEVDDPVSALKSFNVILNQMNSQFVSDAKRPVASMATLRADHPNILSFIRAKRTADFFQWRFNISVFITDELMRAAKNDGPWPLKNQAGDVVHVISAKALIEAIADSAHFCGEPGVLFKDKVEADNPTPQWHYESTAPCAELAMAAGDACQFSYINLSKFVKSGRFDTLGFANTVSVLTRFLDASVESTIDNQQHVGLSLPLVHEKRRIGLAVTGFADLLIQLKIAYEAPEAVHLARQISELLDFHSKKASVELAATRGAFPSYARSRYKETAWVRRKVAQTTGIVPAEAWHALCEEIETKGIRHATTTAMPPTGTSSTIANLSKSLEPHFSYQDYLRGGIIPIIMREISENMPPEVQEETLAYLNKYGCFSDEVCEAKPFLKTACQIGPPAHLAIQAGFQTFLDDAISKTINMAQKTSVKDIEAIIHDAYNSNLKGITVFRDNCLSERGSVETPEASVSNIGMFRLNLKKAEEDTQPQEWVKPVPSSSP